MCSKLVFLNVSSHQHTQEDRGGGGAGLEEEEETEKRGGGEEEEDRGARREEEEEHRGDRRRRTENVVRDVQCHPFKVPFVKDLSLQRFCHFMRGWRSRRKKKEELRQWRSRKMLLDGPS